MGKSAKIIMSYRLTGDTKLFPSLWLSQVHYVVMNITYVWLKSKKRSEFHAKKKYSGSIFRNIKESR